MRCSKCNDTGKLPVLGNFELDCQCQTQEEPGVENVSRRCKGGPAHLNCDFALGHLEGVREGLSTLLYYLDHHPVQTKAMKVSERERRVLDESLGAIIVLEDLLPRLSERKSEHT